MHPKHPSNIQHYDFKTGLPQEFELVDFSQLMQKHPDKLLHPHRTNFYEIIWFQTQSTTHFVDFSPIQLAANSILFVNKSCVHKFGQQQLGNSKGILFTDQFFCRTAEDLLFLQESILFNDWLEISHIQVDELQALFEQFFQQIELELQRPRDVYQEQILQQYLKAFLLHAERIRRQQGFVSIKQSLELEQVQAFKRLLDQYYKKEKTASFYAQQLHINNKKLNHDAKTSSSNGIPWTSGLSNTNHLQQLLSQH